MTRQLAAPARRRRVTHESERGHVANDDLGLNGVESCGGRAVAVSARITTRVCSKSRVLSSNTDHSRRCGRMGAMAEPRATTETSSAECARRLCALVEAESQRQRADLDQLAQHVGALSQRGMDMEFATAVAGLRERERQATAVLVSHDVRLFADLEAMLADVQKEGMPQVQASRNRVVAHAQPFFIPSAPIDLNQIAKQVELSEQLAAEVETTLRE